MTKTICQIKRLEHGKGLPLPEYKTEHAAGMDVYAAIAEATPLTLQAGGRAIIPCGFAMALPQGYEAQCRPRSGLAAKHGISLVNTPGTIDSDYRGEVKILLINHGSEAFTIKRGERIAQIIIAPITQSQWQEVSELSDTARGKGGFGSTGK